MLYQSTKSLQIVKGPSQLELCMATGYCHDAENLMKVSFTDHTGVKYVARITGVHNLCKTDDVYKIWGTMMETQYYHHPQDLTKQPENFSGTYYPYTRKGIIELQVFTIDDKPSILP